MGGLTQRKIWYANASIELHQRVALSLYYSNGFYRPVAGAPGKWSEDMNHDRYWSASVDFPTRSSFFGVGASYSWGELGGGVYGYLAPYWWIRPTKNTVLNFTTEHLHSFGTSRQTIVSGAWDITSQDTVAFRYINSDGDDYVRLAYSRQVRKGINLFAIYDKEPTTPAQLSVKLVFALPFSFRNLTDVPGMSPIEAFFDRVVNSVSDALGFPGTPGLTGSAAEAKPPVLHPDVPKPIQAENPDISANP
jgi:hypothetical protein